MTKPLLTSVLALFLLACGGQDIGQECEGAGSEDDCVSGAICTNESGDRNVCREICEVQEDCPAGLNCNGVTGSSAKSCQP